MFRTGQSRVSDGEAYAATSRSQTQHNYRSHSVDSNLTSLSGGSDLTTASQAISNDGVADAVRIGPLNMSFGGDKPSKKTASQLNGPAGGGGTAGQVPVCTLCDAASSDFSCRACGGLTFCEKCALSLHTNKFLGSHSLQNILDPNDTVLGSDLAIRRATLDADQAARDIYSDEARQARRDEEEEVLQQSLRLATSAGKERARDEANAQAARDRAAAKAGPQVDMKALAADRSVLTARVKELKSCVEILRRLGVRLAEEQASCIDATKSAGDAIRKKFDLLRNLISQKESQFLAVVQDAGKARHEAGASQRTAVAAAVAETSAFVENLELQLQRLEGNHTMFNECRAGLLEDTRTKISDVDGHIHKFEGIVQEVRDIPLGCVVPVDGIVTALQMLQPPERTMGSSEVAMLNAAEALLPVPATNFENSIGVKHFRSGGGGGGGGSRSDSPMSQHHRSGSASTGSFNNNNNNNNNESASQRMMASNYSNTMSASGGGATRNFQIREVSRPSRTSSPMRVSGGGVGGGRSPSSQYQQQQPPSTLQGGGGGGGGGGMPVEVRELRRHLNAAMGTTQSSGGGGRVGSPLVQRLTPTRRVDSPTRVSANNRRSGSPTVMTGGGGGRSGSANARPTGGPSPGPGAYHVAWPLSQRSGPLSTPPRRF